MNTTIKIMRRKRTHRGEKLVEHMAFCMRCTTFVQGRPYGRQVWVSKKSAETHARIHLEWHQSEDASPLPERWYWKTDWPTISEVSDEKKEVVK